MINLNTYTTQRFIDLQNNKLVDNIDELLYYYGRQIISDAMEELQAYGRMLNISNERADFISSSQYNVQLFREILLTVFSAYNLQPIIDPRKKNTLTQTTYQYIDAEPSAIDDMQYLNSENRKEQIMMQFCRLYMSPYLQDQQFEKAKLQYSKIKKFEINTRDNVIVINGKLYFKHGGLYIAYEFYRLIPNSDNIFYMSTPAQILLDLQKQDRQYIDFFYLHVPCIYNQFYYGEDYYPFNHLLVDYSTIHRYDTGIKQILRIMKMNDNYYSEIVEGFNGEYDFEKILSNTDIVKQLMGNDEVDPYGSYEINNNIASYIYSHPITNKFTTININPETHQWIFFQRYKKYLQSGQVYKLIDQLPRFINSPQELINYVNIISYCAWINGNINPKDIVDYLKLKKLLITFNISGQEVQDLIKKDIDLYDIHMQLPLTKNINAVILIKMINAELHDKKQLQNNTNTVIIFLLIIFCIVIMISLTSYFLAKNAQEKKNLKKISEIADLDKQLLKGLPNQQKTT